jgi:segregation and condensation protein B
MSLKAKIEAVIYASEEPVTLAQLTGLLGEEGQAELDALAAQQQSLALEDAANSGDDPHSAPDEYALNDETLDMSEGPAEVYPDPDAVSASIPESAPDEKRTPADTKLRERKLRDYFRSLLDQLSADYANGDRGLEIREVAGGFRLGTKAEYHDAVRGFVKSLKPPLKLTLQALETLAVVAYKQPVTAPEVSEIRGVDSSGVLGSLMTRKLVTTAGRKQVIGRPILYKTTKDFLLRFGLKDINELPSIEEFEKMAGELNETLLDQTDPDQTDPDQTDPHQTDPDQTDPDQTDLDPADPAHDQPDETEAQDNIPMAQSTNDGGGSAPLDERHAVPAPTHMHHDTTEDLLSDKSTAPEGHKHEPLHSTKVEPMADIHSAQADGSPDDSTDSDSEDSDL